MAAKKLRFRVIPGMGKIQFVAAPSLKTVTRNGTSAKMKIAIATFILFICGSASPSHAQYCNPAVVSYLVRDENGNLLSQEELKTLSDQLPKSIGDAHTFLGEVSFADDGQSFYRPESVNWDKGKKLPALQFINAETCTLHFTEITLVYHEKRMRLIFNIEIARSQANRRPVIDSPAFQEGTFELDRNGEPEGDQITFAANWKKIKNKA